MLPFIIIFLVLASILGYKVISAVPPLLHTPLMSGMNAFSGVIVLGALTVYATAPAELKIWAVVALVMSMINVAGGFWVTERMLKMFQKKISDSGDELT